MRGQDGSYLYVYNSDGAAMTIDTTKLSSSNVKIWWYNPRTGESTSETRMVSGNVEFTCPDQNDWVLVIDDVSKNYPAPGTIAAI